MSQFSFNVSVTAMRMWKSCSLFEGIWALWRCRDPDAEEPRVESKMYFLASIPTIWKCPLLSGQKSDVLYKATVLADILLVSFVHKSYFTL